MLQWFVLMGLQELTRASTLNPASIYSELYALYVLLSTVILPVLTVDTPITIYTEVQPFLGWIADWAINIRGTMLFVSVKRAFVQHAAIKNEPVRDFVRRIVGSSVCKMETMLHVVEHSVPQHMWGSRQRIVHLILISRDQLEEVEAAMEEVRSTMPSHHYLIPIIAPSTARWIWWNE